MAGQNGYTSSDPGYTTQGNVDTATPDVSRQQSWQDALAQQNQMQLKYPVDPANGLHYDVQNGKKLYFPPIETPQQYLARIAQQGHGGVFGSDQYYWN